MDHEVKGLDESALAEDPIAQFQEWYAEAEAAGITEPNAMALATVAADGTPSARMVLLRGADERGFVFYTNHGSRKAMELAGNPRAALVFYWEPLHRQVRVEGRVERVSEREARDYFATRPRGSQIAAWASRQSSALASREELEAEFQRMEREFAGSDVPLPPFWGGFRIAPVIVELWQGRANRLHDRVRYERDGGGSWRKSRLAP
jgi:pyridoxamine 5'-phosphate oxidase